MFAAIAMSLLATLSIWDYPSRWRRHEQLRIQFTAASRARVPEAMAAACRQGVELLPDDPVWHYNLACSLAYEKDQTPALDELETAIDLGFRNADAIASDRDLERLKIHPRFKELVDYAREMSRRPIAIGPMANCPATGIFGKSVTLGEQNFSWDFSVGCFDAKLKLAQDGPAYGNTGDLYFNRDGNHSVIPVEDYPGLTLVKLDQDGRDRGMDLNAPNMLFPYPVFGNCSRAFTQGQYWRSLPRAEVTVNSFMMPLWVKLYLSNQVWVFPAADDSPAGGRFGDVFQSVVPYFIVTEGASWSDKYYLRAALECSRNFRPETKKELVRRGALAPTIQKLIRSSLKQVTSDADYLSPKAHPTCMPPNGLDLEKLKRLAKGLTPEAIPPVAALKITARPVKVQPAIPECTYSSALAWAFILRAEEPEREFFIKASGAKEFAFVCVHGECDIMRVGNTTAQVTVRKENLSPTNRVDVAVFGRNPGTDWGAPSFISFSAVDPSAPYSDPFLTPKPPAAESAISNPTEQKE